MRPELGGVNYDAHARLRFGESPDRQLLKHSADASPRVELLLRLTGKAADTPKEEEPANGEGQIADLLDAEKEAALVAARLKELRAERHQVWDEKQRNFRAVEWRDIVVLLRAPSGKAEGYAKSFARAGVPLSVERRGFYDAAK